MEPAASNIFFGWFAPNTPNRLQEFEKNPNWNVGIDPALQIGVATSEYQVNGAGNFPNSTWAKWENSKKEDGSFCIENNDHSGHAVDFWHKPELLISKLKELGIKHYRFSVEWSAIEPQKGQIDQVALNKYIDLSQMLIENGIVPFITLHHFSDPQWFLEAGGFENEKNNQHFIDFSKIVYTKLSPFVKEWITFNEPTIYAFQGYVRADYPPGVKDPNRAAHVLKNMLAAHCNVYDELKKIDSNTKIGIAHQALRFRPYYAYEPIESTVCQQLTNMTHQFVMDFFKTGEFKFYIPFVADVTYSRPDIQDKIDFFGVQYYTDPLIGPEFSIKIMDSTCYPDEKMTHMPFRFYPQGLASLLDECRSIKKPIWITETGAAASEADQKEYIEKALKTASYAKQCGVKVERVHVWSLIDNFEWNMGWPKQFGLFSFDPKTQDSKLRLAGQFLQDVIKNSNEGSSNTMKG